MLLGAAVTSEMVERPAMLGVAALVAITRTVAAEDKVGGAVYNHAVVLVPGPPGRGDQGPACLAAPGTMAENCSFCLAERTVVCGSTSTVLADTISMAFRIPLPVKSRSRAPLVMVTGTVMS